jgi:hypothetical protein
MWRFKILILLISLVFSLARAEDNLESSSQGLKPLNHKGINLSYTTWTELVDLESGALTDSAYANFIGISIGYVKKDVPAGPWVQLPEFSLIAGQANLGGTSTLITYQKSHQNFWGGFASYHLAYRKSPLIIMSAGPIALFRQVSWPSQGSAEAKSGSDLNLGLTADLKYRLAAHWELRQSLGTLFFKASTIWSLGISYLY